MQGGHLFGARRSPENPLTLTNVRWQGPSGTVLDAVRDPEAGDLDSPEERDVWVQLALLVPQASPRQTGPEAPWLPLAVDQEQAMAWVRRGMQSQLSHTRDSQHPGWGAPPRPYSQPPEPFLPPRPGPAGLPSISAAPRMPNLPPDPFAGRDTGAEPRSPWRGSFPGDVTQPVQWSPPSPYSMPSQSGPGGVVEENPRQWTNSWRSGQAGEIMVLPCVEVELPPLLDGVATADYRRDFSRDVAMHFARAARSIQQVREVRGWMRGDRLVLAARLVVGTGNRPPTPPEMDGAARALADVLGQRTLPYAQLGFADPGEWVQGAPLPE
jgi:hypothetical protein